MITGGTLEKNDIPRDEKVKRVRTYPDIVSTGKLSNEREN